ncbi:PPR repeat family protein [Hirsutella rhossiliensis]|uniref:PPR repeat family domain-containing protein n=1 Tax=Hirsutella rhossiliensis TaxID=111463 RepID=A0A9P8MPR7_9HYPO|nr:PPR repeat family domain-containing protein [Hirsutella rhossiliensis]KAH0960028.1 PPR repeat family domain-containing protein [Hirsutella rhossiliensis]
MYVSRNVCGRCASRMHLVAATGRPHAACFSSYPAHLPSEATTPSESPQRAVEAGAPPAELASTRRRRLLGSRSAGFQRPPSALDEAAVAIFKDVVRKPTGAGTVSRRSSVSEWDLATKMKGLDRSNAGARDKLRRFQADIWPHLEDMRGQIPRHLWICTMDFLAGICDTVAREGLTGVSIDLSRICARIGKLELSLRGQLVSSLCHRLITEELSSPDPSASPVLQELLDLWKHISQLRRVSQGHKAPLRFVLPSADEILTVVDAENRGSSQIAPATKALSSILIQFRTEEALALVPGLLATVAVLSDPRLTKPDKAAEAAPLLRLVATALQQAIPDETYVRGVFEDKMRVPPMKVTELQAYVLAQWAQASAMLQDADAPWRHAGPENPRRPGGPASSGLSAFHKQLRGAYRSRNTGAIISIWQDLRARMAQRPHLVRQMREEPDFLDFCIFVWCAVRRPAKLQETLHLMDEIQVQPTIKSYTAMMHGWKVCKETDKVTALWDKLVESGTRLDTVVWTERISGLIEGGRPQAGLRALAEMMALWKQAVEQKGHQGAAAVAVQPSIEVVNAVFKGLVRLDVKAASEVLAWASRHGIEPNVRTYNVLIRQSFRSDAADDVQRLLRTMNSRGVEPDAATFTIILEEVLGAMHNASAAEQVLAVQQVLAEIEAAGLRANAETYGKMLYAVASLTNGGADEAIAAVQRHMRGAGLAATPHVVTILLERALARDPPTPGAVQAILREHGLTGISQGDQTLWERVASAHAAMGDTDAAMAVFADLARAERPVTSLPCLTDLVRALVAAERREDARGVVNATLAHKAAERRGGLDGDRYWRHHFWHLAGGEGLLDWDKLPLELQERLREAS